jgi:hypothetical protein
MKRLACEHSEPLTPDELLRARVDRATRDAWLALHELAGLAADPAACGHIAKQRRHLCSIRANADLIARQCEAAPPLTNTHARVSV